MNALSCFFTVKGADPFLANKRGETPLDAAKHQGIKTYKRPRTSALRNFIQIHNVQNCQAGQTPDYQ